ncbi:MAG: tryptophan--tRNA ligase, partial [Clostridia bacterium]|nr:tryptophan--tRNA ligase [Clostridia bacterium]
GKTVEQLEKDYEGSGYGQFKKDLVEVAVDALTPIRERFNEIRNSQELLDVMKNGAERANAIAEPVVKRAKERFGLGI